MRKDLRQHIETETPLFELLRESLQETGSAEEVRTRRIFIEAWMERERQRAACSPGMPIGWRCRWASGKRAGRNKPLSGR